MFNEGLCLGPGGLFQKACCTQSPQGRSSALVLRAQTMPSQRGSERRARRAGEPLA